MSMALSSHSAVYIILSTGSNRQEMKVKVFAPFFLIFFSLHQMHLRDYYLNP